MNTSSMDEPPLFQEWKERVAREAADKAASEGLREGLREAAQIALESRLGPLDPALETLDQLRARLQPAEDNHAPVTGNAPE